MLVSYWLLLVFVLGAVVGSFLNVAICRLPLEKSLLWPGSRCGTCYQRLRWYDNVPLLSYLWLNGKCRICGEKFSASYFFVELLTALGFVGLFYIDVIRNIHEWPQRQFGPGLEQGVFPTHFWIGYLWHATLFSLLMVASACDLHGREIPIQLTLSGTFVGLVGSALMPWPWPRLPEEVSSTPPWGFEQQPFPFMNLNRILPEGVYPWPVWLPLPEWMPVGSWQAGLATGIAGALVGTFLLRVIGFLFSTGLGREALGMGDADLMMMVGAFLGWQVVVVAFFVSVIPALFIGLLQLTVRGDNTLPFGPSLSLGTMITVLGWQWLGPYVQPLFFAPFLIGALAGAGAIFIVIASFFMGLFRNQKA